MSAPSLIFWAIFVVPLVAFLIWLMRQDKRNGKIGLIVLAITVIGCIIYMFWAKELTF
jgi:bacteriorhodopsin